MTVFALDGWQNCRQPRSVPRTMRMEYPGAVYHLMHREDWRDDLVVDDVNRQDYPETLAEVCQ
jgi:hypothetical protein